MRWHNGGSDVTGGEKCVEIRGLQLLVVGTHVEAHPVDLSLNPFRAVIRSVRALDLGAHTGRNMDTRDSR